MFKLEKNDTIGICAPCSHITKVRLDKVMRFFKKQQINVVVPKNILKRDRFCSGTPNERAADLMELWHNLEIKAIFALRGGYGSCQILDKLDYDFIKANPKIFYGFSDATALNLALLTKANLKTYSGTALAVDINEKTLSLGSFLTQSLFNPPSQIKSGKTLIKGSISGVLVGGNLSILCSLMGTPYLPDFKNKILLIEDVSEKYYRIDRLLQQLRLAGILNQISGLLIGKFVNCPQGSAGDGSIMDILNDLKTYVKCPTIYDFDYSHSDDRYILPIGENVSLNANKCSLVYK